MGHTRYPWSVVTQASRGPAETIKGEEVGTEEPGTADTDNINSPKQMCKAGGQKSRARSDINRRADSKH